MEKRIWKKLFGTVILAVLLLIAPNFKAFAKEKTPETPELKLEYSANKGCIVLSWNQVKCDGYMVCRDNSDDEYELLEELDNKTYEYTDGVKDGKKHKYVIVSFFESDGEYYFSEDSNVVSGYRYCLNEYFALDQRKDAPNGCELYALAALLHYNGVEVDPLTLCEKIPKESAPHGAVGGNPNRAFLGDPTSYAGWGVYSDPITKLAKKYKNDPQNITGTSLDDVLDIVAKGHAVQVWTTIGNGNYRNYGKTWTDTKTGEKLTWKVDNHSLVIIGYTKNDIICSDSLAAGIRAYDREIFEKNYNFHGKQAVYYK